MENLERVVRFRESLEKVYVVDPVVSDFSEQLWCFVGRNDSQSLTVYFPEAGKSEVFTLDETISLVRGIKFISFYRLIFFFDDHNLITCDPINREIKFVHKFETEIEALSWNPLESSLVIISENVISMLAVVGEITALRLVNTARLDAEVPGSIYVGWGSHNTQFKGALKRDVEKIEELEFPCGKPKISWRGSGEHFAVNYWSNSKRHIKVFDSNLNALFENKDYKNLLPIVSFKGQGNNIASAAIHNGKNKVVIFEKNCLLKDEFFVEDNKGIIKEVSFHPHMNALAVYSESNDATGYLSIYMRSNAKWYLKQQMCYSTQQRIINFCWIHTAQPTTDLKLVVLTAHNIELYNFLLTFSRSPIDPTVGVVDGKNVCFTFFDSEIIPPPMFAAKYECDQPINLVKFHPKLKICSVVDSQGTMYIVNYGEMSDPSLDPKYNKIYNLLKNVINSNDAQVRARKLLRTERWLKLYIPLIADMSEKKLKFFVDIFSDDLSLDEIKLNNQTVGRRLIEDQNQNGIENPLNLTDRYYLACRYCLEEKIPELFRQLNLDNVSDADGFNKLFLHYKQNEPVQFWSQFVDLQTGNLKDFEAVEGLKRALQANSNRSWDEGVEYFYNKLRNDQTSSEAVDLLIEAATVDNCMNVDILEFCLSKMNGEQKSMLLQTECYSLISHLSCHYCFDTVKSLINYLDHNHFTSEDYKNLLLSASEQIFMNSALSTETRDFLMYLWNHESFKQYRESVFNHISGNKAMLPLLTYLIVDLLDEKRDAEKLKKKEEILGIFNYVPDYEIQSVMNLVSEQLNEFYGFFVAQLFSKADQHPGSLQNVLISNSSRPYNTIYYSEAVFSEKTVIVYLTSDKDLYINDNLVCKDITSAYVHKHYLLATHASSKIYCVRLDCDTSLISWESQVNFTREVEQGAKIVTVTNRNPVIVLFLPRGNLECISCRLITIDAVRSLVNNDRWLDAMRIIRKEKLDWDLLININPEKLLTSIKQFVLDAKSLGILNIILSEVGDTLKCNSSSILKVLKVILGYLNAIDPIGNLSSTVVILCKHFSLKQALKAVYDIYTKSPSSIEVCKNAIKQILTFNFPKKDIIKDTYTLYDINFLSFVYTCCSEDPKSFEPELRELKQFDGVELRFKMNFLSKNYNEATKYLIRCPNYSNEYISLFINKHKTARTAYKYCPSKNQHFKTVSKLYADSLSWEGNHTEAAIVFERAGFLEDCMRECVKCLDWVKTIQTLQVLKFDEVKKTEVLRKLAFDLEKAKKFDIAAMLYEFYLNDYQNAVRVCLDSNDFKRAICLTTKYDMELYYKSVLPGISEYRVNLTNSIEDMHNKFNSYVNRLEEVRKTRTEKYSERYKDCGFIEVGEDLIADTISTVSTRDTGSSKSRSSNQSAKNRRKEEKKKIDVREGGFYEDIALIRQLYLLIISIYETGSAVRDICLLHVDESSFTENHSLHKLLEKVQADVKSGITRIWSDIFLSDRDADNVMNLAVLQNRDDLDEQYRTPPPKELMDESWKLLMFS